MRTLLVVSFAVLASAASAATPLENAAAIAASLGAAVPAQAPMKLATPASKVVPTAAPAPTTPPQSGSISGYAWVNGSGFLNCSAGPRGSGWMSGWINLRADVRVTTNDGADGTVPVTGTAFLSGSCQNGSGFVNGSATLSGDGYLYKAGKLVGRASLSGNAFINQFVSGPFANISQNVFLTGRFEASAAK